MRRCNNATHPQPHGERSEHKQRPKADPRQAKRPKKPPKSPKARPTPKRNEGRGRRAPRPRPANQPRGRPAPTTGKAQTRATRAPQGTEPAAEQAAAPDRREATPGGMFLLFLSSVAAYFFTAAEQAKEREKATPRPHRNPPTRNGDPSERPDKTPSRNKQRAAGTHPTRNPPAAASPAQPPPKRSHTATPPPKKRHPPRAANCRAGFPAAVSGIPPPSRGTHTPHRTPPSQFTAPPSVSADVATLRERGVGMIKSCRLYSRNTLRESSQDLSCPCIFSYLFITSSTRIQSKSSTKPSPSTTCLNSTSFPLHISATNSSPYILLAITPSFCIENDKRLCKSMLFL